MKKVSSDIYDITQTVLDLEKDYMEEESEDTLTLGTYGYLADILSRNIQNSIIVTSELGNELFPYKAKFEDNVIAHAIVQNITDINATPAEIQVLIGIRESDLKDKMTGDQITLDKDSVFRLSEGDSQYASTASSDSYEFHLPYDLIISKLVLPNNDYTYTARYDISIKNNISDIQNPYIPVPTIQYQNTNKYVFFSVTLMQVTHETIYKRITSSSVIENRSFEFEIDDEEQLADFVVCVDDNGETRYLTPLFEGVGIMNNVTDYCYYFFINAHKIRVTFDSLSYMPKLNSEVTVYIKTTRGAAGNFEYNAKPILNISSDRFDYKYLNIYLWPQSKSEHGEDRKTVDELKKIIPKEALSRGSIINTQDVTNFFNMINVETNRTRILKKVDNQFERSYYAYLLFKDNSNNVVPTNTIDLEINRSEFNENLNRKYILKQGCKILLNKNGIGRLLDPNMKEEEVQELLDNDKTNFLYTLPFMLVVNGDPLYVSYYLNIVNETKILNFSWINPKNTLQFICPNVIWNRNLINNPNKYTLTMQLTQNTSTDYALIEYDEDGNIIEKNIRVFCVFYNDDTLTTPYRYKEAEIVESNKYGGSVEGYDGDYNTGFDVSFKLELETNDIISDEGDIRLENVMVPGTVDKTYGFFNRDIGCKIYIVIKPAGFGDLGRDDLDAIVPGLEGWTVCNEYTVPSRLDLYKDYSTICTSTVTAEDNIINLEGEKDKGFKLRSVPVVRYSYAYDEDHMQYIVEQFNYKKAYIDHALEILENCFLIDFKLYNTYGPSKIYSIDEAGEHLIDRVNMTFDFELKLLKNADVQTREYILKDVKDLIEDLNDDEDLHIPNLITTITTKYRNSIEYFEFLGFNGLGPGEQHLYRHEYDSVSMVPEFLTVHANNDLTPDINIYLA